jgi:adenylate cyclase
MGKPELAIERAQRAVRLSPFDSLNALSNNALAIAYFHTGRYEEARDAAGRAVECNPRYSIAHSLLAAALVRLGREKEAKLAAERALALDSTLSIHARSLMCGLEPTVFAPIAAAWREAGIPDR